MGRGTRLRSAHAEILSKSHNKQTSWTTKQIRLDIFCPTWQQSFGGGKAVNTMPFQTEGR